MNNNNKKQGRPPVEESKRKTKKVIVYMTEHEYDLLSQYATLLNYKTLSPFMFQACKNYLLNKDSIIALTPKQKRGLHILGNNINQIARKLNSGESLDAEALKQITTVRKMLASINRAFAGAKQ